MRALAASDVLRVWEEGQRRPPRDRGLTLLAIGCQGRPREELATLSVGERDARLFALRTATLGPTLAAFAECPQCDSQLELNVAVSDICSPGGRASRLGEHELSSSGFVVRFRLPNAGDMADVAGLADVSEARRALLRRCVISSLPGGYGVPGDELPYPVATALAQRMAELDPQAEVTLGLACPGCDHRWDMVLDIAEFFWAEVGAIAGRLLRQVDALARAYGWSETDILAMSARRRDAYLSLVGA
jgi:hypothetical protein